MADLADTTPKRMRAWIPAALLWIGMCSGLRGQAVYVPNYTSNTIAGYLVNPSTGVLTAVAAPPALSGQSPIQALIHPSGKLLYVLNSGPGDISAFTINAPSGTLTPIPCPLCAAPSPSGMAMHPSGELLFATNVAAGLVTPYLINWTTGALTVTASSGRTNAGGRMGAPVVEPGGRYLYVADSGSNQVFGFVISPSGSLQPVQGSPFPAGSGPLGIAASTSAVFVANQYSADISVYQIGPGGALTPRGTAVPAGGTPTGIGVDPSGNYVYVANRVHVVAFSTTPDGTFPLTHVRSYNAGTTPIAVAADPDGRFVYVANLDSNDVSGFAISAGGTLLPIGSNNTFGAIGPRLLTVQHIGDTTAIAIAPGYPSPASPARFGVPVEIRGAIANTRRPGIPPGGTVTIAAGGIASPNSTVPLSGSGGFAFTFGSLTRYLPPGEHIVQITYNPGAGFEAPAPAYVRYTITKATTVLSIGYSPATPVAGEPMTMTTTALPVGGLFPTGAVKFSVDGTSIGAAAFSTGGSAAISYVPSIGPHTVTAEYDGDSYFTATATAAAAFRVLQATTTALAASTTSPVYGEAVKLTATVGAGGRAAGGSVEFYDGSVPIGTSPVVSSGGLNRAELAGVRFTSIGTHSITAVYSGDPGALLSNSNAAPLTLAVGPSPVSVSTPAVSAGAVYGGPVTIRATVTAKTPGTGTPTGTVIFKEGAATLGNAALANGSAAIVVSTFGAGPHSISASYSGDVNFLTGASALALDLLVAKATPAVAASAAPPTPVSGQQTVLSAVLSGAANASGRFEFLVNGVSAGSAAVSTGSGGIAYTPPSAGAYTISVSYSGDSNHSPASGSMTLTAVKAGVAVSIASAGPIVVGSPATLNATVSAAAPGSGTPGGAITFYNGSAVLGTQPLNAGAASLTISSLPVGQHSVTARYGGDGNFLAGVSSPAALTVRKAAPAITVVAEPSAPWVSGQSIVVVATLAGGTGPPFTGTVDFFEQGKKLTTAPVTAGGARFGPYPIGGAGNRSIVALYSGDENYQPASSVPLAAVVNSAPVTVSAPVISGSAVYGKPLQARVVVSAAPPGDGIPTGNITFQRGTAVLGTAALSNGQAAFTIPLLTAGAHSISAAYSGDANFLAGTSAAAAVTVAKATAAVTVTAAPAAGAVVGQPVLLVAAVGGADATGTVDFFDRGLKINGSPAAVKNGSAQMQWAAGGAGLHEIVAAYSGDPNYEASNSGAAALRIQVAKAAAALSTPVVSGGSVFGEPATFTAAVSVLAPGNGTPTGSVTFRNDAAALGTVRLSGGVATLTTLLPGAGLYRISAAYEGDADFTGVSSAVLSFPQRKASTAAALETSQTPARTELDVIVRFSADGAVPSGTVQFFSGSSALGVAALSPRGPGWVGARLNTGPIAGPVTAVFPGDENFSGSSAYSFIAPASSLELNVSPNPAVAGQPVTLMTQLWWNGTTAAGMVAFYDGSILLGRLPASSRAAFTAVFAAGGHALEAVYEGDGLHPPSRARAWLYVDRAAGAALALEAAPMRAAVGQPVRLKAWLERATPTRLPPSGQVQFLDRGVVLGSAPLIGGTAILTLANLGLGLHQIAAFYQGDANNVPASSPVVAVTVERAETRTMLEVAAAPRGEEIVTVTASVRAVPPGSGTPGGTVQFLDSSNGATLTSGPLISGTATASIRLEASSAAIVAVYSGNAEFAGSSSASLERFSVVNSASYQNGNLAPDGIFTVFAPGLSSELLIAAAPLPAVLGGISVTLTDREGAAREARILHVSPTQLSFLAPENAAPGPATLRLSGPGIEITAVVAIAPVSPGLFAANSAGRGPAAAQIVRVHGDGSQDPPQNTAVYDAEARTWSTAAIDLAAPGDRVYLVLYATGIRHARTLPVVFVGGQPVPVLYAGAQSTYPGLDQVNVLLPESLKGGGILTVTLSVDGRGSNPVAVYFP